MKRKIVGAWLAVSAAVISSLAIAAQAPGPDRPIYTSIKDLMDSIVDPSADVLWGAAGTIVDKDEGIRDLTPKTDDAWHDVRRAAVRMVEGGNLLMMRGRLAAPPGTKSDTPGVELEPPEITALVNKNRNGFDAFARALQLAAADALRASDTKNPDLLMDAGTRMEDACETCHQTFWYPNASVPGPGGQSSKP